MTSHPYTFAEVLEDEYRYFFTDDPFRAVRFEAKHIREIGGAGWFLESLEPSGTEQCRLLSKWHVLAARVLGPMGTLKRVRDKDPWADAQCVEREAIVDAFNELLRDATLLSDLMEDEGFVAD